MCGINGFTFEDPAALRRMHAATKHRGPDDEGFFETSDVSLAHNRLSIIDLSALGHQPMQTQDGRYTIVFNGEIYNYQELRGLLEKDGVQFVSRSDTEVLLYGYTKWGSEVFGKLRGIFAFALWDRDEKSLILARDHIGVKPLYYAFLGEKCVFSSEMKGVLAHGVPKNIDVDSVNLYFRFSYVPGTQTIFSGIKKLQSGCFMTIKNGKHEIVQYWKLEEGKSDLSYADAKTVLKEKAEHAVRSQLVSDRPVGIFLSGGIDSTAVLGMMHANATGKIKTFSVGYEATEEADKYNADFQIAAKTAAHFGTEHHKIVMSGRDVANIFEQVIWHMDEPVSNHVEPSTYFLAQHAKPHITVALGGDGGDELFGGYDRYWYANFLNQMQKIPGSAYLVGLFLCNKNLKEKILLKPGVDRFLSFMSQKEDRVSRFLKKESNRPNVAFEFFSQCFVPEWRDTVNQWMMVDTTTWLPNESLIRTDRMSMAHGLEVRVPLLDIDLVNFAFSLPSKYKLDSRVLGKKILRDALKQYIPDFVQREKKRGFFSPAAKWLRGDMLPLAREILSPTYTSGTEQFIDFSVAQKLLEEHKEKQNYHLHALWSMMTFQVWWRKYME